jgi:hypothetical protein
MTKSDLLTAPLTHVKRQFNQSCLFVFRGAVFLSTPNLVTQARIHADARDSFIVLDSCNDPVRIDADSARLFYSEAHTTLEKATDVYLEARKVAEAQFVSLLTVQEIPDETTE